MKQFIEGASTTLARAVNGCKRKLHNLKWWYTGECIHTATNSLENYFNLFSLHYKHSSQ